MRTTHGSLLTELLADMRPKLVLKCSTLGSYHVILLLSYQKEALQRLSDISLNAKVDKDLTFTNQQELPATATNLIITTSRSLCIYFLPKIHKPNNPGLPISLLVVALTNSFPAILTKL